VKVAIIAVFMDYHRRGAHHRSALQPQIGPLLAALLPPDADIEVINDTWVDPDWRKRYDLVFLSCVHSDFDRARQIARYFGNRGAKTVLGGTMASTFPHLCAPYFDAVVVGDPEDTVPQIYKDVQHGCLQPLYRSTGYHPEKIPTPRTMFTAHQQLFPVALEATRGCPFTCDFCALTGIGTRFKTQPVKKVAHDIICIKRDLTAKVPFWRRQMVMFYDNNLAGNLNYFRDLCDELKPLNIFWGACLTFNVLTKRDLLKKMYQSGCRTVFVGLESFNPAAIADFNKHQNRLSQVRRVFNDARAEGILVTAGLMLSPLHDDVDYIRSIPKHLKDSGLHIPTFVCIETAIPGTPLFNRLADTPEPSFMPNTCLHDYNAYSLVIRPQKASTQDFIDAYQQTLREVYCPPQRLHKLVDDLPRLLRRGSWMGALISVASALGANTPIVAGRTFVPKTDTLPLEVVPFTESDFDTEKMRLAFLKPTRVTDDAGRVLPMWRCHDAPFAEQKGRSRGGQSIDVMQS
jgi:hypothetical protein